MNTHDHGPAAAVASRLLLSAPRLVATVAAVCACVFSSLMVVVAAGYVPVTEAVEPSAREVLGLLTALAAAVALIWRHRQPIVVTLVAAAPPLLFVTDSLAALVALAAVAARRRDHVLWATAAVVFLATLIAVERDARRDPEYSPMQWVFGGGTGDAAATVRVPFVAVLVVAAAMTAIPVGVGLYRQARAEIAVRDGEQRALFADKTRHEERARIAREMHDVLGHRLSLLSLQAGALEADGRGGDDAARAIRQTARQSLDDLRQVVGVLRDGRALGEAPTDSPPAPYTSPALADLPDLVDASRRSGIPVNATIFVDDAASAPEVVATATYRIVQESLTNVARHAPGVAAHVVVRGRPDAGVTIDVTNPLPAHLPEESVARTGSGLIGMAERASALGGTVTSGPDGDAFTVTAWLPWTPDPDEATA